MGLIDKRLNLFTTNETFVRMIQLAKEDPEIQKKLIAILSLDPINRVSALNALLSEMNLNQAPKDFIGALTLFLDGNIAAKALRIVRGEDVL
jgi:hypothetical protein